MPQRRIAAASLALALTLLVPAAAGAVGLEKGVKAGVNLSNFRGAFAELADTKTKMGFTGGAFVAFGFAPDLAIQVEGLYSMKGAKIVSQRVDDAGNVRGTFDTFVKLSYLEVPVLLRGTLLRGSPVQPMYYLGPTVGFCLGGRQTLDGSDAVSVELGDLKAVDLGLALGAGVGIKVGGRRLLTELRYNTGFADVYDIANNLESINQGFALTAGLAF
jgi:hypothetical protein